MMHAKNMMCNMTSHTFYGVFIVQNLFSYAASGTIFCKRFFSMKFYTFLFYSQFIHMFRQGTQNTTDSTLFCFWKSKQIICLLEGRIRQKTINECKQMYFYYSNGLAYFWRAKHKQQIVFYLYFYVPCVQKCRKMKKFCWILFRSYLKLNYTLLATVCVFQFQLDKETTGEG